MKYIRYWMFVVCVSIAFAFNACVDVKIAQEIPKTQYFSLSPSISTTCSSREKPTIALFDVQARPPFDSKNIIVFDSQHLQVDAMSHRSWASLPALMINDKIFILLQNACYNVSMAPFGTQKFDFVLKMTLHSMQILTSLSSKNVQVSMSYEILNMKDYKQKKSGVINKESPIQSLDNSEFAHSFSQLVDEVLFDIIKDLD